MPFTKSYDPTSPSGSDRARFGANQFRDLKSGLQERLDLEHYGPALGNQDPAAADADCRHRPGFVSAVFIGTKAQIDALVPGGVGALAFGTDTKLLYIWDGSSWETYTLGGTMKSIQRGNTAVAASATVDVTLGATVDAAKSILHMIWRTPGGTVSCSGEIIDGDTIRFQNINGAHSGVAYWQVIEYN